MFHEATFISTMMIEPDPLPTVCRDGDLSVSKMHTWPLCARNLFLRDRGLYESAHSIRLIRQFNSVGRPRCLDRGLPADAEPSRFSAIARTLTGSLQIGSEQIFKI